jgi:4a-hydroxytetrahydrobiopterin dehydratase
MGLRTPLTADEVAARLAERPGWTGDTHQIEKTFEVDYDTAIRIVTEVGKAAIELEHRPDIDIRWDTLRFAMTTHTAGDQVTNLDLRTVDRIESIVHQVGSTEFTRTPTTSRGELRPES